MEPPKHPIRLLLFDRNETRRVRLHQLLDDGSAFAVVGLADRPENMPVLHDGATPEVILVETSGHDDPQSISSLRTRYPDAVIAVYSLVDDFSLDHILPIAPALGISSGDGALLADRLRANLETGQPLEPADLRALLAYFPDGHASQQYGLSRRERQVLQSMVDGLPNKQIASQLGIGEDTVKKHLKSIYTKLQVSSGKMAVVKALRERLVL
jgi:DNA-binding NarL/FixJ family response regulator